MSRSFDARNDCAAIRTATRAFADAFLAQAMPSLAMVARGCGYALAVHGSLARDIDLIAVPWVESADDPALLLQRICGALSAFTGRAVFAGKLDPATWTEKPHGRRAVTIILPGMCPEIDLSILPLARIEAGTAGTVKQGPAQRAKAGNSSKGQSHA